MSVRELPFYMPIKLIPKKNQKVQIGRVIDLSLCASCGSDCLNCTNYAKEYDNGKYTVEEFVTSYREYFLSNGWTRELVNEFLSSVIKFPKNHYQDTEINQITGRVTKIILHKKYYSNFREAAVIYLRDEYHSIGLIPMVIEHTAQKLSDNIVKDIKKATELFYKERLV